MSERTWNVTRIQFLLQIDSQRDRTGWKCKRLNLSEALHQIPANRQRIPSHLEAVVLLSRIHPSPMKKQAP